MMKHILFLVVFFGCIISSCTNNTKENTGLQVEKAVVTADDKPAEKKEFTYGENINIRFKNVTGLTNFEGKMYPEALIYLLNEKKDTVEITEYEFPDQFINDKALDLDINFMAVLTEASDENFELKIKLEDKKGAGFYNYSMPFKIKPNENFSVTMGGIKYSNIYLFNAKNGTVITDNSINLNEEFSVIYEGLNGFESDGIGFVYPAATAKLVDAKGTVLLDEKNILKDYQDLGFKFENAFKSLPINIKLKDSKGAVSPVNLSIEVYDIKSDKKLALQTKLTLK